MELAIMYHYAREDGSYIGVDDKAIAKPSWVEVPEPDHGAAIWNNGSWDMSIPVRLDRNQLLVDMDEVVKHPIRWSSMTDEKRSEWTSYRQALLDIPQQAGFPDSVVWPNKPS